MTGTMSNDSAASPQRARCTFTGPDPRPTCPDEEGIAKMFVAMAMVDMLSEEKENLKAALVP